MTRGFAEIVVGGVLIAPFVGYCLAALVVFLVVRSVLFRLLRADRWFAALPTVEVCLYVCILACLIVLF